MNKRVITYIAVIITIAVVVSAAFIYTDYSSKTASNQSNNSNNISIVDDAGFVTTLTSLPQRIVSLAPSCTQILYAIGDGSKVVAVTASDDYPLNFTALFAEGKMLDDGLYGTPNMEVIAEARPQLIIGDSEDAASYPSMRALGYNVIELNPSTVAGIEQDIMMVGRATGAQTEATAVDANISNIVSNIQAKIAAANITATPGVFYEVWNDPFMSIGSGSWISDAIAQAGGANIFENVSQAYPTVSSETVVQLDPSIILLPSSSGGMAFYGSVAQVEAQPGWNTISAVQNSRVYIINQDLLDESGPRVGELVQDLAEVFYPQLFNTTSTTS